MNTARLGVVLPALFLKAQTNYQRDIGISFPVTLQQGKLAHITLWTPSLYRSRGMLSQSLQGDCSTE